MTNDTPTGDGARTRRWPVLVVDDDPAVLRLASLILGGESLDGIPVEVITAASGAEARAVLTARPDVAVAIIDVIMETREAGLDLVRWLSACPAHAATRRVLHTGQPGVGREEQVSRSTDIHDYWAKGTLRAREMRRRLVFQLRQHRDLVQMRTRPSEALRCVAYRSRYVGEGIDADVERIRASAQRRNPELGVSGALLVCDGRFFQLLEGPTAEVRELYARIARDPRHTDVTALFDRPTARRSIPDWSMRIVQPRRDAGIADTDLDALLQTYARDFRFEGADAFALMEALLRPPPSPQEVP